MDRDKRWERTQIAYDLIKDGNASHHADTAEQAINNAYERAETDAVSYTHLTLPTICSV